GRPTSRSLPSSPASPSSRSRSAASGSPCGARGPPPVGARAAGGSVAGVPGYLRSLNPQLPRAVQILQLGGLANAFGNGIVLPLTFIYLHNVRGIGLGTAGLVLGTNAGVSLVAGPLSGVFVDRVGGKRTLAAALAFLTVGYGGYAFVHHPWQGFATAAITGVGNGAFWPAQSTLIAALVTPE